MGKADEKKKAKSTMAVDLDPPSGTRDFFPDEMRVRSWLFDKFRSTAAAFGFSEYDAPVLEKQELFKRKAGEEITQQMYAFTDKEGAEVTLRPEMTPSLARMVLSLMRAGTGDIAALMPLKWFSIPQCWRFETTQRGRKREHFQWNMDIVGVNSITADVELLASICYFFESVGLGSSDIGLKVNSRKVLGAVIEKAGVPKHLFGQTCVIIDKQDKIGAETCEEELVKLLSLPREVAKKVLAATQAKSIDDLANVVGCEDSEEILELKMLFSLAESYGIGDWLIFDASVVRGLAYYTGVVFEGFDRAGVLRAVCGGGRYDGLLTLYGSKKEVPCAGFGFGDCVIMELLMEKGKLPSLPKSVNYVVAPYNKDMQGPALQVANLIRKAGKSVDMFQGEGKKVAKCFNYADRVGADRIAFVGPDEWEKKVVRIKDLRVEDEDAKQRDVPLDRLGAIDDYFPKVAPNAVAASSVVAAQPEPSSGKSAPTGGGAGGAGGASGLQAVEKFLLLHPYLNGFEPSRKDREAFDDGELAKDVDAPVYPNIARWQAHMASFTATVRGSWP